MWEVTVRTKEYPDLVVGKMTFEVLEDAVKAGVTAVSCSGARLAFEVRKTG